MPAAVSLTVKKADEVTNITYDIIQGSPGDTGMALWRQDTGANAALPAGMRATLMQGSKWNGPKTARRVTLLYNRPYALLNTTTQRYEALDKVIGRTELLLPFAIPAAELNESVYQYFNLLGLASGNLKITTGQGYAGN